MLFGRNLYCIVGKLYYNADPSDFYSTNTVLSIDRPNFKAC